MSDIFSIPEFSHLTPMTNENKESFVDTLANAFLGYPQLNLVLNGKTTEKNLRTLWHAILNSQKSGSFAFADSPDIHGALIVSKIIDSGTKTVPFLLNGGFKLFPHIPRLLSYESYVKKIQSNHVGKDTWYIFTFGVEKASQGKHIASALMQPFLSFLDRIGTDCFLETHDKKNVPLYEHYGFKLVETGTVPHSALTHYAMLRTAL